MRARWIAVSIAIAGAAAVTAIAEERRPASPIPILHEDVRPPPSGARARHLPPDAPAVLGEEPAAGRNPTAIRDDGKILPEPEASPATVSEEPIHGRGGFGADRHTENIPDDRTR
ncbi:MAG TPA: hypothetical protein VEL05_12480, partial [Candidatus Acidoferrum sp.]|nr:hypothetical protein [Candidatus Acidoferrum sp.]